METEANIMNSLYITGGVEFWEDTKEKIDFIMWMPKIEYIWKEQLDIFNIFMRKKYNIELDNILSNENIIEIWPWYNPLNKIIDIKNYFWIDYIIWDKDNNIVEWDALSILKKIWDNSWMIVSFWVLDISVINSLDYLRELKDEIIRVSNGKALLIWSEVDLLFWKWNLSQLSIWGWLYDFNK